METIDQPEQFTFTPEPELSPPPPLYIQPEPPKQKTPAVDRAIFDIFDTDVVSPFDAKPEGNGIVSPFDFSDKNIVSIFAVSDVTETPKKTEEEIVEVGTPDEPEKFKDAEEAKSTDETEKLAHDDAHKSRLQDFLSRPVVFPFDEDTGYVEPSLEPEPEEVSFDDPEDETVTYMEPPDEEITVINATETADAEADDEVYGDDNGVAEIVADEPAEADTEKAEPEKAAAIAVAAAAEAFAEADDEEDEEGKKKKKEKKPKKDKSEKKRAKEESDDGDSDEKYEEKNVKKGLTILIDIVIILVVLFAAGFAILKFAPGTGAAHFLNMGIEKVTGLFGASDSKDADDSEESLADDADSEDVSSDSTDFIPPQPDMTALVSTQAGFFNMNIAEVIYDATAVYDPNRVYVMTGVNGAKPIENDYWTSDTQGAVLYDEAAVATVIRFNSALVSYTGGQQSDILAEVETGSQEESALAEYAASLSSALAFKRLGIGDILTDGTYYYVFTNETVVEMRNEPPAEVIYSKVYKLVPATETSTMKITEIETLA
jgi:hypothetical protein